MAASSSTETNQPDKWSAQAELYSNQAARLTELHGADMVTILKNDILQAKTILDVGCGTGAFAKAYLQQFPNGIPGQTLILSDLSEGMLEKAKETVMPKTGFQTKIVFQVEDGTKLEGIADNSIDIVVSLFGVFLIPDQTATLKAISRVLKKEKNLFANASWIFEISDYFSSQGFGVSLQDAFKLPNDVIDPNHMKANNSDLLEWGNPKTIPSLLNKYMGNPEKNLRCYPAIHNTVWEFDALWTMMCKNPVSAIPTASNDDVAKAKVALQNFVTQNGKTPLEEPIMLSTASILTLARDFGKA